jgi:hypothetical protein
MSDSSQERRDGELSEDEAAVVRKLFMALGLGASALLIIVFEIILPIDYVVIGVLGIGTVAVLLSGPKIKAKK